MNKFNRGRSFFNLDINKMESVCNTTIKNIMTNFLPHGTIICHDRDPPSINNRIKKNNLRTKQSLQGLSQK